MIAATEDDMDEHVPPSVLRVKSGIKEKLAVTDLINQLDIHSVLGYKIVFVA
jgi:hypothetical protein